MTNEIFSLVFKFRDEVVVPLPGSLTVYEPPVIGPPMLMMVNVAVKSLLQATPRPRYGSLTAAPPEPEGVEVLVEVAVFRGVGVSVGDAVGEGVSVGPAILNPWACGPVPRVAEGVTEGVGVKVNV